MRTISAAKEAVLAVDRQVRIKVSVKDAAASWQNLCSLNGVDWVQSVSIDTNLDDVVDQATISLWRNEYYRSMAPLVSASEINMITGAYAALLNLKSEIKIEAAIIPIESEPAAGDWMEVFLGYIAAVEWGGSDSAVTLTCRDQAGLLMDTWIETEEDYGADDGSVLAEDVIQGILNDNGFSSITLYTPTASAWAITPYSQKKEPVLQAIRTIALQRGWDVRYKWDSGTSAWRLTFYEPDRDKAVADRTFGASQYYAIGRLGMSIDGIRTICRVVYTDEADNGRKTIEYPETGLATAGGAATLTNSAAAWVEDELIGKQIYIYAGTGIGQLKTISDNDATSITASVAWATQPDNTSKYAIVTSGDSAVPLRSYGRRFMEIAEASTSQINTASEASTLARSAYLDLSTPSVEQEVELPYFPFSELGDLYTFSANYVHYDTDQSLAVCGITHNLAPNQFRTTLICRGKPAGAYRSWLSREAMPGVAPPATFNPPTLETTAPTASAEINSVGLILPGTVDRRLSYYDIQRREANADYDANNHQYIAPAVPSWSDWASLPGDRNTVRKLVDTGVSTNMAYQYRYAAADSKDNLSDYTTESASVVPRPTAVADLHENVQAQIAHVPIRQTVLDGPKDASGNPNFISDGGGLNCDLDTMTLGADVCTEAAAISGGDATINAVTYAKANAYKDDAATTKWGSSQYRQNFAGFLSGTIIGLGYIGQDAGAGNTVSPAQIKITQASATVYTDMLGFKHNLRPITSVIYQESADASVWVDIQAFSLLADTSEQTLSLPSNSPRAWRLLANADPSVTTDSRSYWGVSEIEAFEATGESIFLAFANGFTAAAGAVDYLAEITDSEEDAWTLTDDDTNYLYFACDPVTREVTCGTTILEPIYSRTDPSSGVTLSDGQYWCKVPGLAGKLWDTAASDWEASAAVRVYVGEVVTASGAVDSITIYPYGRSPLMDALMEEQEPVGTRKEIMRSSAPSGRWLKMNGLTIGDPSSGATGRAREDVRALFELLWDNVAQADCQVRASSADDQVFTATAFDIVDSASHGLSNTDKLLAYAGTTYPTGLAVDNIYYVVNAATNAFGFAATSGGAMINLSGQGTGAQTVKKLTLAAAKTFTSAYGTDTLTGAVGTSLTNGQKLYLTNSGGALPAPLVSTRCYYVRDWSSSPRTFKLALTSGGAAIDITDDGTGTHSLQVITEGTAITYTVPLGVTCAGHGYVNTDTVVLRGADLPAGWYENTLYYVVNAQTDEFQISLTSGGAAVNPTDAGSGTLNVCAAARGASAAADWAAHCRLPLMDERELFSRGWADDKAGGVDAGRALGSYQADQNLAHTHSDPASYYWSGGGGAHNPPAAGTNVTHGPQTTGSNGGADARPRNRAWLVIIKY